MSGLPTPRGRKRGIALLLAAALVVAGSVAAGQLTSSRELQPPVPESVAVATSGTAYCPVTASEGEGALLTLAAVGEVDAEVVLTRYADGVGVAEEPRLLPAGGAATLPIDAAQLSQPLTVDWRGGPVVAHYQITDGDEVLAATCPTAPSTAWHMAGFDTSLGSTSLLHLFNPFGQDALVSLEFGTPEGRVELVIADELLVPAGTSTVLNLAQFRPEAADLAVTVRARAGRVVPQGQVSLAPPAEDVEGITGRALIPAAPAPGEVAVLPDATADALTTSWLTVYNPGTRAAAVQVQVSTPLGDASALATETSVPAGGTTRIDLAGLSALPDFGVRVGSVNGVGIVVTRTEALQDVQRQGIAVSLAAPEAEPRWAVVGATGPEATVTLYNPSAEVATAAVDVQGGRPETWTALSVPPNGLLRLPLSQATPQGPALVSADIPLVAGVVSLRPESATAYWSGTGVATESLVGGGEALAVQRDPGLGSIPAISATATPTPVPVSPAGTAEGGLGEDAEDVGPTADPTPTTPPTADIEPPVVLPSTPAGESPDGEPSTPQPGTPQPGTPQPTTAPAPAGEASPGPSPLPPGATEEGSLFGKVRRGGRTRTQAVDRRRRRPSGPWGAAAAPPPR